ncbi:MAG: hypothetical protein U9N56_04535 [Actinomycetota bacterium]|nr:hypothetical protein [Actinomycetota bacterium]
MGIGTLRCTVIDASDLDDAIEHIIALGGSVKKEASIFLHQGR